MSNQYLPTPSISDYLELILNVRMSVSVFFCDLYVCYNPMYLRDLLTTHNPTRNLRSSSQHLLSVGYMRTVSSSRCFKHSAALNWNDLPYDIRACDSVNVSKRKLKTHLFNIAYPT